MIVANNRLDHSLKLFSKLRKTYLTEKNKQFLILENLCPTDFKYKQK